MTEELMMVKEKTKSNGEAETKRERLIVPYNSCSLADAARNTWEVVLPVGATPEDLLDQDALGPISKQLTVKDMIFAQPRDGAWLGIYRVLAVDAGRIQMALLQHFPLPQRAASTEAPPAGFDIRWDDVDGWHALRLNDNVILGKNLLSFEAARRYIQDHPTMRGTKNE